jgi:glycosyltransferase involved in cell wall biosynthesis
MIKRLSKGTIPRIVHMSSVHTVNDIRFFHKMAVTLAENGYDTYCIALHSRPEVISGVKIIPIRSRPGIWGKIVASYLAFAAAVQLKPLICHIHTPRLYIWIPFLKIRGVIVILDMYENFPKTFEQRTRVPAFLRTFAGYLYKYMERVLIGDNPVIYAEYSYAKDYPYVKEHRTILNMPKTEMLLAVDENKLEIPTIGYLGGICETRGSLLILRVIKKLREQGANINAEFIGQSEDTHQQELETYIRDNGLIGSIRYYGFMPPPEAYQIAAKWHVGLAVFLPMKNYVDSYPTKMFEYMALGLPVVVSKFPLYEEIVHETGCGLCVNPLDEDEIAGAIKVLLNNRRMAIDLGKKGRCAVLQKYSWKKEAEKLLAFYKQILFRHNYFPLF